MTKDDKINKKFDIPLETLEDRISYNLNGDFADYKRVVSLKDLAEIQHMMFFKKEVFEALIRGIVIRGTDHQLYKNSGINVYGREPKGFNVGQTFILESKILGIMEGLEGNIFSNFISKGLSKMPPTIIYGKDLENKKALAFYIPPLIEIHEKSNVALIDGAHRSYICKSAGTTVNGVHITRVDAELPFESIKWDETNVVKEKPSISNRYRDLKKELFRDLTHMGIDG